MTGCVYIPKGVLRPEGADDQRGDQCDGEGDWELKFCSIYCRRGLEFENCSRNSVARGKSVWGPSSSEPD